MEQLRNLSKWINIQKQEFGDFPEPTKSNDISNFCSDLDFVYGIVERHFCGSIFTQLLLIML